MAKKLIAEFFGTFTLALIVILSITGNFTLSTPLLAALTLSFFVYTIGPFSGSHINPAVTLGLWSIGKFPREEAFQYIAAQLIGGALALILAAMLGTTWPPATDPTPYTYLFELLGTLIFTLGIGSVIFNAEKFVGSSLIIGLSLLLGISISVLGGGPGILNPVVALTLKVSDAGYYLAEIIGAAVGFKLSSHFSSSPGRKKR